MAYRRRYNRRSYGKRFSSTRRLAASAYRKATYLSRNIDIEFKKRIHGLTNTQVPWTGTIYPMSDIGGGTNPDQRVGRSILSKHLSIKWALTLDGQASHSVVNLFVILDTGSGTFTMADVLEVVGTPLAPLSMLNIHEAPRFKILRRIPVNLTAGAVTGAGNFVGGRTGHDYVSLGNAKTSFTGQASTDLGEGHIFLGVIGSEQTHLPILNMTATYSFTDS